jgi:hypothetical protein
MKPPALPPPDPRELWLYGLHALALLVYALARAGA